MKVRVKLNPQPVNVIYVSSKMMDILTHAQSRAISLHHHLAAMYVYSYACNHVIENADEILLGQHQLTENDLEEGMEVDLNMVDDYGIDHMPMIRHLKLEFALIDEQKQNDISMKTLRLIRQRMMSTSVGMPSCMPICLGQTWYFKQNGLIGVKVISFITSNENVSTQCAKIPLVQWDMTWEEVEKRRDDPQFASIVKHLEDAKLFNIEFMLRVDNELFSINDLMLNATKTGVAPPTPEAVVSLQLGRLSLNVH
jgi:hypothetical protein